MDEVLSPVNITVGDDQIEWFAVTGVDALDLDDPDVVRNVVDALQSTIASVRAEQVVYAKWLKEAGDA